ncbi:MAG: methyltransferase domain-containing protein [Candidatus Aenigmarchaeota archaeon]|nr:methyltransferase domain-containing protein [Candidatus Aenigmarchaeota archaeon]
MEPKDPVPDTIKTYDGYAETYDEIYGEGWSGLEEFREIMDEFVARVPGKRVLDIGCGPGRDAKYFSEKGLDVTAIELSKAFLEIARKNVPQAKVIFMDMRHMDFPGSSFDGLWATASFLHIPKNQAKSTLEGFSRILKSGGLMFISVKQGEGEKFVRKDYYNGSAKFFAFYTREEFEALLGSAGFKVEKVLVKNKNNGTWISVFASKS